MTDDTPNPTPFDREKWKDEIRLREREIIVKEQEQQITREDLDLRRRELERSRWTNPLVLAIFAAAIAALGNAGVAWFTSYQQQNLEAVKYDASMKIEESKSEAGRILEAIKTNDPDKAANNLAFLNATGLITNPDRQEKLSIYLGTRKQGEGAALPAGASAFRTQSPVHEFQCAASVQAPDALRTKIATALISLGVTVAFDDEFDAMATGARPAVAITSKAIEGHVMIIGTIFKYPEQTRPTNESIQRVTCEAAKVP